MLEQMRVHLSALLRDMAVIKATTQETSDVTRAFFQARLAPRAEGAGQAGDIVDIEMVFRSTDPPESVMRVIDMCANLIEPRSFPIKPDTPLAPMDYAQTARFRPMLQQHRERMSGQPPERPSGEAPDSSAGGDVRN